MQSLWQFLSKHKTAVVTGAAAVIIGVVLGRLSKSKAVTKILKLKPEAFLRPVIPVENEFSEPSSPVAPTRIKVMSYNVLAQIYANMSTNEVYNAAIRANAKNISPEIYNWEYRSALLVQELSHYLPDIACLQELQNTHSLGLLHEVNQAISKKYKDAKANKKPAEEFDLRYAILYMARPKSFANVDGCGVLYNEKRYDLIEYKDILLNDLEDFPQFKEFAEKNSPHLITMNSHVLQIVLLEDRMTRERVCVANTHFYWDPKFADLKLFQSFLVLHHVEQFLSEISSHHHALHKHNSQVSLFICGDMNSMPDSAVYELYAHGKVSDKHEEVRALTGLELKHNLQLKSAYAARNEPLSNMTGKFKGCLDYIWFSQWTGHSSITPWDLKLKQLLLEVDLENDMNNIPLPNTVLPSDHTALMGVFDIYSGAQ